MTTNQIAYFKAKIEEAHYKNLDSETRRHNVVTESQNQFAIEETQRSNMARESIQTATLAETQRHNTVQEAQAWTNLSIQQTLAESTITLQDTQRYLNELEAVSRELNNSLNAKYSETERVLGGSGNGKKSIASTAATVVKVATAVKSKNTAKGLTSEHDWNKSSTSKAVATPLTGKVAHKETSWYYGKK